MQRLHSQSGLIGQPSQFGCAVDSIGRAFLARPGRSTPIPIRINPTGYRIESRHLHHQCSIWHSVALALATTKGGRNVVSMCSFNEYMSTGANRRAQGRKYSDIIVLV